MPDYIDLMDICVIPHSNEYRSPIKMFEYMAMEKPVIAPRFEPIKNVIEDGQNGILFNPNDKEDFMRSLDFLMQNSLERERLGMAARNAVIERHTWRKNAQRIERIANEHII